MRLPLARKAFVLAYTWYKEKIEAGPVAGLHHYVAAGSLVVDVGANIGFFTTRFADWVGPGGHVVAIEPDLENFGQLERRLARHDGAGRVSRLNAVAASERGTLRLRRNEVHPGDHKIATDGEGIEVAAVSIDDIVRDHHDLPLSLVKIDVQGAEMIVLAGASHTLRTQSPALFVEVDEMQLAEFGASSAILFNHLKTFGYQGHNLAADGTAAPIELAKLQAQLEARGYIDVLFLKPDAASS